MKIITFIEKAEVVKKILKHLGLWKVKSRPPPRIHSTQAELYADYSDSQIPLWDDDQTSVSHPTSCISHLPTKIQPYYH
jgi:hypothetical protein